MGEVRDVDSVLGMVAGFDSAAVVWLRKKLKEDVDRYERYAFSFWRSVDIGCLNTLDTDV